MICSHCGCDSPRVIAYGRAVFCPACFDRLAFPPWDEAEQTILPRGYIGPRPRNRAEEPSPWLENATRALEDGNGTEELMP